MILIDTSFLAYQSGYTMSDLSYNDMKTGVIYGILSRLLTIGQRFRSNDFVFCFDSRTSKRKELYPDYKKHRDTGTDEQLDIRKAVHRSLSILPAVLGTIGFRNIYSIEGYESDDIIATICRDVIYDLVIVSNDSDLYQCLYPHVRLYNPSKKELMDMDLFYRTFNIVFWKWGWVKAMAGCKTDNVEGIEGIGNKSAIAYLNGELKKDSVKFRKIACEEGSRIYGRNMKLVMLPMHPIKLEPFQRNGFSKKGFLEICEKFGLQSFLEGDAFLEWKNFFLGKFEVRESSIQKKIRKRML